MAGAYERAALKLQYRPPPPGLRPGTDVLDGSGFGPQTDHVLVTGKLWPWLYEIEVVGEGTAPAP